jgi:hypothetical protein
MPKLHALFVGINQYAAVTPLHGCVEDITAIEALFRERVAADDLALRVLRDGEATRAAIIEGFEQHLAAAGPGDFALFYYCGHGSQEPCPPEWLRLEPSGLNQTLLPVDARTGDIFDLADKELTTLIHGVAERGAHVVTIFDSCHSGGVTRSSEEPSGEWVPRMTSARRDRPRTLDDYLPATRTLYASERLATSGPPEPRHIAIAACQPNELAKEFPRHPPPRRGAFSQAFEEALRALGPTATYVDLVNAIRARVRDRAAEQLPNLHVAPGASGTDVFLAGQAGRRDLTIDADGEGRWWLSAGAIDGLPSPDAGEVTEVALHARGSLDSGSAPPPPLATAVVDLVEHDRARLRIVSGSGELSTSLQYLGTITRLGGAPALLVTLDPAFDAAIAAPLREALLRRAGWFALAEAPGRAPTVSIRAEHDTAAGAEQTFAQIIGVDGAPIQGLRFPLEAPAADAEESVRARATARLAAVAAACQHLGRWYGTRDRANEGSSLNGQVQVELVPVTRGEKNVPDDRPAHQPEASGSVVLRYAQGEPPRVQFRIHNRSSQRLFVALLDLTNTFECAPLFSEWIPAGGTGYVRGGRGFSMQIPAWPDANAPMATDDLKIFAAVGDFDVQRWTLPALVGPSAGGDRAVVFDDEEEAATWGTSLLHVEIRR